MPVRVSALALAAAALSACSGPTVSNTTADVNAAASLAQGDIDTYAANTLAAGTANLPAPAPRAVRPAAPHALPPKPAATEVPAADEGAQAAAAVARRYFELIGARRYAEAWALWDEDGRASGMTRRQFADSFAGYAGYSAEIGPPGRVDAGAGQRFVEVPVRVRGVTAEGGAPFAMRGSVTLHRTAAIDGATPAQRAWRIRASTLRPPAPERQAATATGPAYDCAGTTRTTARDEAIDPPGARERGRAIWRRGDAAGAGAPCTPGR